MSFKKNDLRKTLLSQQLTELPNWNAELRELRFFGKLVKRLRRPARAQEAILSVFQEEGWPAHVLDPLPPVARCAKQRLREIVANLNGSMEIPLIHFECDGAEGIRWTIRAPSD